MLANRRGGPSYAEDQKQRPMRDTRLVFAPVDAGSPEAATLMAALDAELDERYPGMAIEQIEPVEFSRDGGVFLVAKHDGVAVACGALRRLTARVAEVRRMFVRKEERGRGFGRAILLALEHTAEALGYHTVRLGTGINQPEAIALYESVGYKCVPCFGEYLDDPRSRCFEKSIAV
jgi:putative acetyltransferase